MLFTALTGFSFLPQENIIEKLLGQLASLVFPISITPEDLRAKHDTSKVRVLIVPGHDNKKSGASFGGVREADLTLQAAEELYRFLDRNNRFEVFSARDFFSGEYTPELDAYFKFREEEIKQFRNQSQAIMEALIAAQVAEDKSTLNHGFAKDDISLRLYGINKWSNENNIDIVMHIHFNDYPRRRLSTFGEYSGFSIYVPESQYPNGLASIDFAKPIFDALKEYVPVSDMPYEKAGIIEDQELIAVGSNGSREGVSLLIEYGYLYESQFRNAAIRKPVIEHLAFLTYQGIKEYFLKEHSDNTSETTLLPHFWDSVLEKNMRWNPHVLSLQAALYKEGVYPPPGKDLRGCPMNGNFGSCVEEAVRLFQDKYREEILVPVNFSEGTGIVSPLTLKKLNSLYGQ